MVDGIRRITQIRLRAFLASTEGQEVIAFLVDSSPRVVKSDAHQMLFDSGRVEGCYETIDRLKQIAFSKEEPGEESLES